MLLIIESMQTNLYMIVLLFELSIFLLFQYVLFVLWFLFISAITLSTSGLIHYTWRSVYAAIFGQLCKSWSRKQPYFFNFTVREVCVLNDEWCILIISISTLSGVIHIYIMSMCPGNTFPKNALTSQKSNIPLTFL